VRLLCVWTIRAARGLVSSSSRQPLRHVKIARVADGADHELERQARNRDRPAHIGQPKDADAPHPDPWLVQQAEGPDREDDAKLGGVLS